MNEYYKVTLRFILCLPLFVVLLAFDVVKIPVLIVASPLWLLLDLIDMTKGKKSLYLEFMADVSTIGWQMCKELMK